MSQLSDAPLVVPASAKAANLPAERLVSLDVFRGATIAFMIIVNNQDEEVAYWPLKHARWNGWTPTDLVFPFFLFIVGVALAFSFAGRLRRGESRGTLVSHVMRRGLILFAIGFFLHGFSARFQLDHWRVYGVLQRIAICYVISAVLVLYSGRSARLAAVATACLVSYWLLMRYVPVPGFGVPLRDVPLLDPDRNLAAWLDRKLLMGHLYEGTRDPEGVLSTIPALATSLLGVLTGQWLGSARNKPQKAAGLFVAGLIGVGMGEALNPWFPINKKLWTSTYVLLTAGLALMILALLYWLVDGKRWRGPWTKPFVILGMNAIAAYVFAELLAVLLAAVNLRFANGTTISGGDFIHREWFAPLGSPASGSLLFSITFLLLCWFVMWVLYRRRIFIKI
ncbi:MAG TPA: heparan-alpha-glucosaminide N-acetyltransferase domain-containing protein [Candidatus Acidoferrales bacterium]|nr:heparan-alpha-glucosaminide N-acetyltransferase domain-containing protein [Candidatus Acidoferrales bacterium]